MLYAKRTTPDNWVPPDFLKRLQENASLQFFDLQTIVLYSGLIFQQLCCICLFVASFIFLLWEWMTAEQLAAALIFATFCSFILWWWFALSAYERTFETFSTPLRTGLIILVFSSALAPVLHSLLDTVSTDTTYAMTFLFLLLNFVSIPYGNGVRGPRADGSMDSNVVSVATGFLASLCMASRLPGPKETLILILSATLVFATWPTIRHRIQFCGGKHARLVFTVGLGASGAASLLPFFLDDSIEPVYKRLLAAGVVLSTFLINFGIPLLFYRMQYAKHRINGPWDEAVVER